MSQQQNNMPNGNPEGKNPSKNLNDVYKISGSERRGGRGANHGKVKFEKGTMKAVARLFSYFGKANIARMILVLACVFTNSRIAAKSATFIGRLIDEYITPMAESGSQDFGPMLSAMGVMACYYLATIICQFTQRRTMIRVSNDVLFEIRKDLFAHMQTLPVRFFDINSYGDIMSRFTNDIDNIRMLIGHSVQEIFSSLCSIVIVLISMLKISWQLTLVVFVFIILMYIVTVTVGGRSSKYYTERQKALGSMNGYIEETLNGQKVVQAYCHEEESKNEFDRENTDLFKKAARANSFANVLMPLNGGLGNIQYVTLAIVGGYMALNGIGGLSLGLIISFLALAKSFTHPITSISQQFNSFVMALAGAKRVFAVLDAPSESDEGYVTLVKAKENADGTVTESNDEDSVFMWKYPHHTSGELEYIKLEGKVVLENVDFGYVPDKQILYDVSLFAKPGQKIAFVGSTGAGKTTITNLINRFYDIEDGKIRIDGVNINKIKKGSLRMALGIVLQDTNLFTGTIADNIRFGKLDATMDEIKAAAKLANADRFIEQLPQGYDTIINGTDCQLSQGQCQLLAIARCAIADPPIMILDEATSSIDTRTEVLIQSGMDHLMAGRTTFVIAHRLSTVQNSNAIMVVEGGHIIERGNHDELIEQKGRYYTLYTGKTN